jgi:hypothetical protein
MALNVLLAESGVCLLKVRFEGLALSAARFERVSCWLLLHSGEY